MAAKLILAASQGGSAQSGPAYRMVMEANVRVPARDGITLATDIYRPDAPGKFPAILERTPYNRAALATPRMSFCL